MTALTQIHEGQSLPKPLIGVETQAKTQTGLLVMTVGCAVLALIPPFRVVGSLLGRSIAFLSRSLHFGCEASRQHLTNWEKALEVGKLAVIVLGFIAVAAVSPVLVIASLVADAGLQAIELVKALHKGDYKKAFIHLGLLATDTLVITAIAAASWKLMVAAAAVSAFVLLTMAFMVPQDETALSTVCYIMLAGVGAFSGVLTAEHSRQRISDAHFRIKNEGKKDIVVERNTVIRPGQTKEFTYDGTDTLEIFDKSTGHETYVHAYQVNYSTEVTMPSLNPLAFPTLPVGTHVTNPDMLDNVNEQHPSGPEYQPLLAPDLE